jgi:hypothetical protein
LKKILEVGESGKMLVTEEIQTFLNATAKMSAKEQKNVLEFVKALKENTAPKITPEYLKEVHPFENFKKTRLIVNAEYASTSPNIISDANIKASYDNQIERIYAVSNDFKGYLNTKKVDYFSLIRDNKKFLETISKSSNPKKFFNILEETGVNENSLNAAEDLIKAFNLSKENPYLVRDLGKCFSKEEIKDIIAILEKSPKSFNLETYYPFGKENDLLSTWGRKMFVKVVGLEGKYTPAKTNYRTIPSSDVYPHPVSPGKGHLTGGNFERGKKQ